MATFGERLKMLRTEKRISLEILANELHSTKATLSRYENSKRTPNIDFAKKVANFFEVEVDYVLGNKDERINLYEQRLINELKDYPRAVKIVADAIGLPQDFLEEQLAVLKKLAEKKS